MDFSLTARCAPRVLMLIAVSAALTGCGQGARSLALDQPQARDACTSFLTAWKDGKKLADLKPAIVGRDYAWDAGKKLKDFEILPQEKNDGTNLHIPVRLTLADDKGKESTSNVTYVVGTSPVVTVFRE
jgi:hypothetical protein